MVDSAHFEDTSTDYEQFETELFARDRDAARLARADLDEATARHAIIELVDDGIVTPVSEDRVLVHEPSRTAFDSIIQLAVFHQGWTAARTAEAEAQ